MEWISVEERLPEPGIEVLLAYKYNTLPVQAYYSGITGKWQGSMAVRDNMKGYVSDSRLQAQDLITHWQPLPKMPKYD